MTRGPGRLRRTPAPRSPGRHGPIRRNWTFAPPGADPRPSIVSFDSAVTVHWITTYHWNGGGGAPLGTIALRAVDDGTTYGPWNTIGIDGQGGVPNAYWQATVDETFPPGRYEVIDSDPATWAQNAESGGRGFVTVYGWTAGPSVG